MSPVVAAYGGVGQARVTRAVDAVGVRVQFDRAASTAGVSDITAQHLQDTIQRGAAVHDWLWCILGRQMIQEVEGGDLDSELHVTWRSRNRTFVMFLSKVIHSDDAFTVKVLQAGSVSGVIIEVGLTAAALSGLRLRRRRSQTHRCTSVTAACRHPAPQRCFLSGRVVVGGSPALGGRQDPEGGRSSRGWSAAPGGQRSNRPSPGGRGSPRRPLTDAEDQ